MYPYHKVKLNIHVLPKTARVVIPVCPGVAKCLKDWVGLDQSALDAVHLPDMTTALSQIQEDVLRCLCIHTWE